MKYDHKEQDAPPIYLAMKMNILSTFTQRGILNKLNDTGTAPHTLNVHTNLLWNSANKKTAVVDAHADPQCPALADFVVVQHSHGLFRLHGVAVHHEGIAAVLPAEVHHEPHLVKTSYLLEHRHQFVFKAVSRYLADKDLASPGRWRSFPVWWRSVATLSVLLHDAVSCTSHELGYGRGSAL